MASSLDGKIRVFTSNTYATPLDGLVDHTILDGDGYTYTSGPSTTTSLKFVDYEYSAGGGAGWMLLDINDGATYCFDEIQFPTPKPRIEWRDPAHGDGRDVNFCKYENRIVNIKMHVFGTDEADLASNIEALWEQFLADSPILEWRVGGWTDPLYFDLISPPLEINTPDWFETYMRENGQIHVLSNIELVLEAKPFLRGAEETVVLLDGANGVSGIVLDETHFKGDVPAPADIFVDLTGGTLWTDLIFGQRLKYSASFDPIQEPTAGTNVGLATRLNGDYRTRAALTNLVANPSFETPGGGHPDDWANWAELPSGNPNTVLQNNAAFAFAGTNSVQAGCTANAWVNEQIRSDLIPTADLTKPYYLSYYSSAYGYGNPYLHLHACVYFYDATPTYLGFKEVASILVPPTYWTEWSGYVYPGDFPAGTTQVTIGFTFNTWHWSEQACYIFLDLVTFSKITNSTIDAEFPLDSHEGRYLPIGAISFEAGTNVHDNVTFQAMLATVAGDEITPSIVPMIIDPLDPVTKFVDVAMLNPRAPIISIPTHRISGLADKSNIEQIIRLATDPLNLKAFWYDYVGIVPIDRAYAEVRTWSGNPHLILDGRSSQLALTSLTGTLDDAQTWSINKQKGDCSFVADPQGFNGAIVAVTNVAGDYQVLSTVNVTMVYNPLYLLVPTG